ncbi:hypothetical protein ACT4MK_15220 [Bradyrhizobium barranii]|uniref:hypothetical protein n=1 Tax=Bradyrhizobium TaxID=374 RepID=UPI003F290BDF
MPNAVVRTITLASLLNLALASSSAFAQSGSAGGSIGNDEKSLSGSRQDTSSGRSAEPAAPSRRSKPATEERSSPRRSGGGGGGGGGGFDGAWAVVSVGCGGSTSGAVVVSSGKIIGEGVRGTVSTGRLSGRSGSGTWRRSDGCGGTWSSAKQ